MIRTTTLLLAVAFVLLQVAENRPQQKDTLSTRSARAEGTLRCGANPIEGAVVRLFKGSSDSIGDVLGTATTDRSGYFTVEGDTSNFAGSEANIDPFLKIYHKCDDADKKSGYRRVTLRFPRDFVTIGRVARRTYNIGTPNLQIVYPSETRVDTIEGLKST